MLINQFNIQHVIKTNCFLGAFTLLTLLLSCTGSTSSDPTPPVTEYTITFDSKGGSVVEPQTVPNNLLATEPIPPPTQANATFQGWSTQQTSFSQFDFTKPITNNIILYARWVLKLTNNNYIVTFNSKGGPAIQQQSIPVILLPGVSPDKRKATEPPTPTKTGSTFGGWYTDLGLIEKFIFTNQIFYDLTLYAKWHTVLTFNSQGGSPLQPLPIIEGSKAIEPTPPTYSNKAFDGWHTDSTLAIPFDFNTPITNAITLYAKWGPPVTITFNSQSGSDVQPQIIVSNSKAREPTPPTYNTYGFGGWYTESKTINPFDFNTLLSHDITLYAKWGIPITVTFNHLDGATTNKVIVADGEKTAEPMPTRPIYVLLGWYTDVAFSSRFDFTTPITNAITLYAKWEAQPTTKTELITLINQAISDNGDNVNLNFIKTSHITDMSDLFKDKTTFNGKINSWDTSEVTSMENMFYKTLNFNQNISNWNTFKVTNMNAMFYRAEKFNQNIGSWNVTNVIVMREMFKNANTFNQYIGEWNVSMVTAMSDMFWSAENFNQDIGSWNVTNVTTMENMFRQNNNFNQNIGSWNTSKVTNMRKMFESTGLFNQDISNWDVSSVTTMFAMFFSAKKFNQDLEKWKIHPSLIKDHMFTLSLLKDNPPSWYSN